MNLNWFGLSTPVWWIPWPWKLSKALPIRLFTCYRRYSHELHDWGIGVLSVNGCHLFYVGDSGVRVFYVKVIRWQQAAP